MLRTKWNRTRSECPVIEGFGTACAAARDPDSPISCATSVGAFTLLLFECFESICIRVDRRQSVEHVERHIDCLAVTELLLAVGVVSELLTFDVLHDEIPLALVGAVSPDDLNNVRMIDLSECADLTSHRVVTGCAVKQFERSRLALDDVPHAIDL